MHHTSLILLFGKKIYHGISICYNFHMRRVYGITLAVLIDKA